jgi:hypothetical protein
MTSTAVAAKSVARWGGLLVLTGGVLWCQAGPKVLVAVFVPEPRFQLHTYKTRGIYDSSMTQRIPLRDFDFRAALADELMAKLSEDKRFQWRLADAAEHERLRLPFCGFCPQAKDIRVPSKSSALAGIKDDAAVIVQVIQWGGTKNGFSLSYSLGAWRTTSGASTGHFKRLAFHQVKEHSERKLTDLLSDPDALRNGANRLIQKAAPDISARLGSLKP